MRILIFGTGSGLGDLLSVLPPNVEIIGLLDNNPKKQGTTIGGKPVHPPSAIASLEFDRIVISPRDGATIRNQLVDMGVPREKVLVFYSTYDAQLRRQVNEDIEALNRDLGVGLHPLSLCTMQMWPVTETDLEFSQDDYCRIMAIRLAAQRILARNTQGAIAELGVYKGELAARLNRLFPERKLYLFDTFEGFSENDLADGLEKKHSVASVGDFQDTNVDLVMSRMAWPEKVIVRKGYFPQTAEGLDETFAFVSLDVDLYKPIVAGLQYFYPRLSPGGCMFIHDYNNLRYKGVKTAVEEFVEATGAPLVQLPDLAGTAILSK
jgi:hypothetical protein